MFSVLRFCHSVCPQGGGDPYVTITQHWTALYSPLDIRPKTTGSNIIFAFVKTFDFNIAIVEFNATNLFTPTTDIPTINHVINTMQK